MARGTLNLGVPAHVDAGKAVLRDDRTGRIPRPGHRAALNADRGPAVVWRGSRPAMTVRVGGQDSVSASSDTAVRGSSMDRTAQIANAPMAYGTTWTSAVWNEWPFR